MWKRLAVCSMRFSSLWKASLKPRPGMEGMTRWNGWWVVGSEGSVRGLKSGARRGERLGWGKEGRRMRGMAWAWGDLMCRKWIRMGWGFVGMAIAVRNWGRVVLRVASRVRHE